MAEPRFESRGWEEYAAIVVTTCNLQAMSAHRRTLQLYYPMGYCTTAVNLLDIQLYVYMYVQTVQIQVSCQYCLTKYVLHYS